MQDRWESGLRVTRSALAALHAEARRTGLEECCGLLLGRAGRIDEVRPAANLAADRSHRFEIDPQALVDAHRAARAGGPEVIGYFHSHPRGTAEPSATDRALAAGDGRVWAIVAGTVVTWWRDQAEGFVPLSYTVEDG